MLIRAYVSVQRRLMDLRDDQKGVSSLEYIALACVVIAAVVAGGASVTTAFGDAFTKLVNSIGTIPG